MIHSIRNYTKTLIASFSFILLISLPGSIFCQQDSSIQNIDSLFQQMNKIQETIKEMETRGDTYERLFKSIMPIAGGVFTIFTLFFAFSQWLQTTSSRKETDRYLKLVGDQNEKLNKQVVEYQEYMRNQDENLQGFMERVKENIQRTTDFVSTLDDMVKLSPKAQDIEKKINNLIHEEEDRVREAQRILEEKKLRDLNTVQRLNAKAIRISDQINKSNFSSIYNIGQYRELSNQITPIIALDNEDQIKYFNACIYFVVALDLINQGQYKDAIHYLDEAQLKANEKISEEFREVQYPEEDIINDAGGIEEWNKKLINAIYFHRALVYFRKAQYVESEIYFREATEVDKKDYSSTYFA